jgi:hypothetical protein
MGNSSSSTKKTKRQREVQKVATKAIVQNCVEEIETKQKELAQAFVHQINEPGVPSVLTEFCELNQIAEIAKHQLKREDGAFTKADYVAILVRLQPSTLPKTKEIWSQNSVAELRLAIRTIIYGVESKSSQTQQTQLVVRQRQRAPDKLEICDRERKAY